jgi:hypothetical protein
MTIQEVAKSGKSFRRKFWQEVEGLYLKVDGDGYIIAEFKLSAPYCEDDGYIFKLEDILSDDWEVKQ